MILFKIYFLKLQLDKFVSKQGKKFDVSKESTSSYLRLCCQMILSWYIYVTCKYDSCGTNTAAASF